MATTVDIVNTALSHLGNKAVVVSIDPPDGSAEGNWAARFYAQSLYSALELTDWGFARTRAVLSAVTPPSGAWACAYSVPSDCIRARRIPTGNPVAREDDSEEFEIEGTTLLTDKADATLIYTQPITDASKFPPSFVSVLSYMLASYLAGPILKAEEGVRAATGLRKLALEAAAMAAASDGNQSQRRAETQYTPRSLQVR